MDAYRARVDAILENRWQTAESERLVRRKEEMENQSKIGENLDGKKDGDDTSKETPDDFTPAPFLPEGIDSENSSPDDAGGQPFLPLPEGPALPEPDPNAPPGVDPEPAPSPFPPLAPL